MKLITLLDETKRRRALIKPLEGQPCNGCGYCCHMSACDLALEYLGAAQEGPCPALEFEDDRFWCGLVRNAGQYMGLANEWADPALGSLIGQALGIEKGCDASIS